MADGDAVVPYEDAMGMRSNVWKSVRFMAQIVPVGFVPIQNDKFLNSR